MGAHLANKGKASSKETAPAEVTDEGVSEPESSWNRPVMEAWITDNNIDLIASDYSNKKKLYSAMKKAYNALPDA